MAFALRAVARGARPQVATPVLHQRQRRRIDHGQAGAGIGRLRGEAGVERRGDFRAALPRALAGEARALRGDETGVDILLRAAPALAHISGDACDLVIRKYAGEIGHVPVEAAIADADRAVDAVEQDLRDDIGLRGDERRAVERRHRACHARGVVLMAGRAARDEDVGAALVCCLGQFARHGATLGMADRDRLRIVVEHHRAPQGERDRDPIDRQRNAAMLLIGLEALGRRLRGRGCFAHFAPPFFS